MKRLHTLIVIVLVLAAIIGGIWFVLPDRETTDAPIAAPVVITPHYAVPAAVQPIVSRLGLDQATVEKINIETPVDATECNSGNSISKTGVACSFVGKIIYPQNLLAKNEVEQNRVFAHEYLHEIWAKMSYEQHEALKPSILEAYQTHVYALDKRLGGYNLNDDSKANELHSYICTEMADNEIPQPLLSHCVQYVPNRAGLPSYY